MSPILLVKKRFESRIFFFDHVDMQVIVDKLQDLFPEHKVALSIPRTIDESKETLNGDVVEGRVK